MTVSVLMVVEGSSPEISRCINVEETLKLGELAQLIDAALGFSGAATHLFVGKAGVTREVYAEVPALNEHDEDELTVAEMEPMTYVYDPAANWNIHVEVLGQSQLDGPTPMLIDAAGPDVVEACSGPDMMTQFRREAVLLAAGIEPDYDVVPLMFSFLPVMPPERILDRLTVADPVSVATRIAYIAEELFFDQAAAAAEENSGGGLMEYFDAFMQSRPELQEVLDMDPHPERNPSLISAVSEFFDQLLDGTAADAILAESDPVGPPETFRDMCVAAVDFFSLPVPLDGDNIIDAAQDDFSQFLQTAYGEEIVSLLVAAGFIERRGEYLVTSKHGQSLYQTSIPTHAFADELRAGFEDVLGEQVWREAVEYYVGTRREAPDNVDDAAALMMGVRILGGGTERADLTPDGRDLLREMLHGYQL